MNAAHARHLEVRRLLIGRLDEAERTLAELDPAPFPSASRAAQELVVAGIAMRRLRTKAARAALARAERAARHAGIAALTAEVERASLVLNTPAARLDRMPARQIRGRYASILHRTPCELDQLRASRTNAQHGRDVVCLVLNLEVLEVRIEGQELLEQPVVSGELDHCAPGNVTTDYVAGLQQGVQ